MRSENTGKEIRLSPISWDEQTVVPDRSITHYQFKVTDIVCDCIICNISCDLHCQTWFPQAQTPAIFHEKQFCTGQVLLFFFFFQTGQFLPPTVLPRHGTLAGNVYNLNLAPTELQHPPHCSCYWPAEAWAAVSQHNTYLQGKLAGDCKKQLASCLHREYLPHRTGGLSHSARFLLLAFEKCMEMHSESLKCKHLCVNVKQSFYMINGRSASPCISEAR